MFSSLFCSADELLHTGPSPSPLPILSTHFGIDNSATFYELNLYDGKLKLSGHISDPREILSLKVQCHSFFVLDHVIQK